MTFFTKVARPDARGKDHETGIHNAGLKKKMLGGWKYDKNKYLLSVLSYGPDHMYLIFTTFLLIILQKI